MRTVFMIVLCVAGLWAADSQRGEKLFHTQGCIQCHSIHGTGGSEGPDLSRRIARGYTPALLASTMWNHGPSMWSVMRRQGVELHPLETAAAADLLAFFASSRFFDIPADAGRGKRAFQENRCADCHGLSVSSSAGAPPVVKWQGLEDPIALAESMWNHAGRMQQEFVRRNIARPELTSQELSDILVYLRNQPEVRATRIHVRTSSGDRGSALIKSKGCEACHTGALDLGSRTRGKTLTDVAAAMWNHAPKMERASIEFEPGEMNDILSTLWSNGMLDVPGSASKGEKVFRAKNCESCHGHESGRSLKSKSAGGGEHTSLTMISALWRHGPAMLDRMRQESIPWPRLSANDMSDLIAFLNAGGKASP